MALKKENNNKLYTYELDGGRNTQAASSNSVVNKKDPFRPTAIVDTATGNITTSKPNNTTQTENKVTAPSAPAAPATPATPQSNYTTNTNTGSSNANNVPVYEAPRSAAPTYSQSQSVSDAYAYLQNIVNNKPGAFSSAYQDQLQSLYDSIMNRDKFSYDLNNDALYQQYAKQYAKLGNQAMQNTMASAAALTGGYGSSYASTAGQQAYNAYLSQLGDIAPELYTRAYERYQNEGNDLLNRYQVTNNLYEADYNKYRDSVNDYQNSLNYAYNNYNNERDLDYQRYLDSLSQYNYEVEQAYNRSQDALSQQNRDRDYAYQLARDAISDERYNSEIEYQKYLDEYQMAQDAINSQANLDSAETRGMIKGYVNSGKIMEAVREIVYSMPGASYSEIVTAAKGFGITEKQVEEIYLSDKDVSAPQLLSGMVGQGLKRQY